jgi:hypothetical protein
MAVDKLVNAMRSNPRDWKIGDIERVCKAYDISCSAPKRGSHYKLQHTRIRGILTVPARKPIKPIYIKLLLEMIDTLEKP